MPIAPPIIAALIGLAGTGVTTGLEASGALGGGGGGPSAQQIATQENQANQKSQQLQEQQAFKRFAPDAQAQTGGALSDTSLSAMIAELAGSPADTNLAQQTLFGNAPGLSTTPQGLGG